MNNNINLQTQDRVKEYLDKRRVRDFKYIVMYRERLGLSFVYLITSQQICSNY